MDWKVYWPQIDWTINIFEYKWDTHTHRQHLSLSSKSSRAALQHQGRVTSWGPWHLCSLTSILPSPSVRSCGRPGEAQLFTEQWWGEAAIRDAATTNITTSHHNYSHCYHHNDLGRLPTPHALSRLLMTSKYMFFPTPQVQGNIYLMHSIFACEIQYVLADVNHTLHSLEYESSFHGNNSVYLLPMYTGLFKVTLSHISKI